MQTRSKRAATATVKEEVKNAMKNTGIESAIFFDNEQKYIDVISTCGIEAVKVPGSPSVKHVKLDSAAYTGFQTLLSEKAMEASAIIQTLIRDKAKKPADVAEKLDVGSGIGDEEIKHLESWIEENSSKRKAAIFDFDRTLTVMEGGMYKDEVNEKYNISDLVDGFAEYYAGGFERLSKIQKMFDLLYDNNVYVFLLTNNPNCESSRFFQQILDVFTRARPLVLLCAAKFGYDKKRAIQEHPNTNGPRNALRKYCFRGGKRHSTRRR